MSLSEHSKPKELKLRSVKSEAKIYEAASLAESAQINNGTNHNQNIFEGCYNLTGGKGTVYDDEHIDLEYAHIDDGKNNPGYLTAVKTNTEANNTIVIDIPEETMDLVSDLYNSITDPLQLTAGCNALS